MEISNIQQVMSNQKPTREEALAFLERVRADRRIVDLDATAKEGERYLEHRTLLFEEFWEAYEDALL